MGNDNKQKTNGEIDPFSRFIFGNRKQRETYTESENNSQELPEQNEQSSFDNKSNRTDEWFFGSRRKEPTSNAQTPQNQISFDNRSKWTDDWPFGSRRKEPTSSAQTPQNQIENFINNLDFELLMETYDMLVDTSKQLKPLMKEITPFFHQFSKKFKSN